jgi:HK97 family phage prohead protease
MPWHLEQGKPGCSGWAVVKTSTGKTVGCHQTKAQAQKQLAALYAQEGKMSADQATAAKPIEPPKENLYRAIQPGYELREASEGGMPTMAGHFAVFNQWTEIDSIFEGRFMERLTPGSFSKTITENRPEMRVLFQHGRDYQVGDKPLGPIAELREEDQGPYYEVPLLDTSYNRDLLPGLEAGLYGASFRFRVMREEFEEEPAKSVHNPEGIPERTIKEVKVMEFGPVTFPAYAGATAGVRSLTDEILFGRLILDSDPKGLQRLMDFVAATDRASGKTEPDAPSTPDAGDDPHLGQERRVLTARRRRIDYLKRREESWTLTSSPRSRSWTLD